MNVVHLPGSTSALQKHIDSFFLNIGFLLASNILAWLWRTDPEVVYGEMADKGVIERLLFWLAMAKYGW